jgi:hypothetical protein
MDHDQNFKNLILDYAEGTLASPGSDILTVPAPVDRHKRPRAGAPKALRPPRGQ